MIVVTLSFRFKEMDLQNLKFLKKKNRFKSKGKLSQWSHPIQCERKWKYSFLSDKQDGTHDAPTSNQLIESS